MNNRTVTVGTVFAALGRAVCYLFLFLLCQVMASMVYSIAAMAYALDGSLDMIELVLACTDQISLFSGVATLILLAAFFLLRQKNPLRECGFRAAHGRYVLTACAVTPPLYLAVSLVLGLLPEAWMEAYAEASAALNETGIIMTLATVLVAPIVEEVIFRGLILSRLRRAMPGWLAVVLSALAFGLCHGQIVWIAYATLLGLLFGFMALRSGSIWPSLAAHIIFNGIGQLMVMLGDDLFVNQLFVGILIAVSLAALCIILPFRATHPLKARNPKFPADAT